MPKINLQGLRKLHESRVNRGKNPDVWDAGCVIPEKLYVGSLSSAKDIEKLKENKVTKQFKNVRKFYVDGNFETN